MEPTNFSVHLLVKARSPLISAISLKTLVKLQASVCNLLAPFAIPSKRTKNLVLARGLTFLTAETVARALGFEGEQNWPKWAKSCHVDVRQTIHAKRDNGNSGEEVFLIPKIAKIAIRSPRLPGDGK
jgi:hypothetical protein